MCTDHKALEDSFEILGKSPQTCVCLLWSVNISPVAPLLELMNQKISKLLSFKSQTEMCWLFHLVVKRRGQRSKMKQRETHRK